jgi:hypothetical protein
MTRKEFFLTTTKAGIVTATLASVGCGSGSSGSDGQTITTGFNGLLSDVSVSPAPGAVFIGRATRFTVSWPFGDPPREFTVFLRRFLEPIGGEEFETPSQRLLVSQIDARTWELRRENDFELDANAVYFLDMTAPGGQRERVVYITGSGRAVTFNPGSGGALSDIRISPAPGSYGISRAVGADGFELEWDFDFPPPSQFTVRLRRFKERRGSDNGGDSEQATGGDSIGGFTYVVRRQNRFELDGLAAYYLEVEAPGQGSLRAAFTTSEF